MSIGDYERGEKPTMDAVADWLEIIELPGRYQIMTDLSDADAYAELYALDGRYERPFAPARDREDIGEMSMRLARADSRRSTKSGRSPTASRR